MAGPLRMRDRSLATSPGKNAEPKAERLGGGSSFSSLWRRLNLWPRLVIAVTAGFVALFVVFSLLALRAVDESTDHILKERLVIAQMAARELDRLLRRTFSTLETSAEFARFDPEAPSLAEESRLLGHVHSGLGGLSLCVYFLDARRRLVLAEPPSRRATWATLARMPPVREVLVARRRSISAPFRDPSGKPAVALAVPVRNADGSPRAVLVGVIDVSASGMIGPLKQATRLGHTGHGELVGPGGIAIASTERGDFLKPGEHGPFYRRMLRTRASEVENAAYTPWHEVPPSRRDEKHVMAFAPLAAAPWGVAVGGLDSETFAPVNRLRRTLLLAGALSLAGLWALTLLGARLLVRPVRLLTRSAREMAGGNLEERVRVGEGGEIGVLAESLEAMRAQLKESLETVRRWGEQLEVKVAERTEELTVRNRQLAAVTAVATAANQARDLDGILHSCLDAVLEHTAMDAGAVRLLDEKSGRLAPPLARGAYDGFPCGRESVGTDECPCGVAVARAAPLYLGPEERLAFHPPCHAPADALVVIPLRAGKGTIGVLALARRKGSPPDPEERHTLAAIGDQIAVAIESARLREELGRIEAQREVQRMKAELISAVSHELRTPLGFIKGYATTLLREGAQVDAATQRQFLEVIDEETTKLEQMVDELLDASRLQAGRLPLERVSTDLGALVDAAVGKMRPVLEETGHAVELRIASEGARVLADPMRTEQVLNNLLENAARYSEPGTAVEVGVFLEDGHAVVSVGDHGEGIAESEHERIFEPFYRGESSRRRGVHGAGLGLAICHGIVEAQDGKIWVESAPGKGATFLVSLPTTSDRKPV